MVWKETPGYGETAVEAGARESAREACYTPERGGEGGVLERAATGETCNNSRLGWGCPDGRALVQRVAEGKGRWAIAVEVWMDAGVNGRAGVGGGEASS